MPLAQLPTIDYCGLTIILGKPSRFDTHKLLSGHAGYLFTKYLHPAIVESISLQVATEPVTILPNTKVVLLLGDEAVAKYYPIEDGKPTTLNDARGNPAMGKDGVIYICSYAPQDAADVKDYESPEGDDDDGEDLDDSSSVKSHGVTKRRNWKWWLKADIKKAFYLAKHGMAPEEDFNIKLYPEIDEVINTLLTTHGEYLYLDIETAAQQTLTCVGFNFSDSKNVYVVPWKTYQNTLTYSDNLCRKFIQALAVAMGRNTVVCHNAAFDLLVLAYKYKIPLPRKVEDTMLMWHRCYPEVEKSLGHLISYFLNRRYHKGEGIYSPHNATQELQLYTYNGKDIVTTRGIHIGLKAELVKTGAEKSADWANRMLRPYLTATLRGIKTDVAAFCKRYDNLEAKRLALNRCIAIITSRPDMNVRSWQQVTKYLYAEQKLPCPDPKNPTNSKTLLRLLTKHKIPSIKLILMSKRTGKLSSSMKIRLWMDLTTKSTDNFNRWTCAYNIAGTDSFRLGSRAIFKYKRGDAEGKIGYGTNLQNQKKEQRTLFVSDTGLKLGQVDQAGAEALIVAYLCRHGRFRDLFLNGIKSHVFVGLHVFKDAWKKRIDNPDCVDALCDLNPRELKLHPDFKKVERLIKDSDSWPAAERYYFIAKMICHASNYGMKHPTFQIQVLDKSDGAVQLSSLECMKFLELYHKLFPEIRNWHASIQLEINKSQRLVNLFDEPRIFNGHVDDQLYKSAYAFKHQSTVGQITNYAFTEIQELCDAGNEDVRRYHLELLQNNHDSILFQFKPEFEKEAVTLIAKHMERDLISPAGVKFKMKVELQSGYNWCPFKKTINDMGLKEITYG